MLDIRRVLCPIDYSDASRRALDQASMIAGWFGARVTVLHVCPAVFAADNRGRAASAVLTAETSTAAAALTDYVKPLRRAGVAIDELVVEDLDAESRILETAASTPADLIVMGTHGRTGLGRLLIGSVTDHVLRHAPCPVLTVPPTATRAAAPPFKRVLCPIDFTPSSADALRLALRLAQEADARLTLLHVIPDPASHEAPARYTPAQRHRAEESACYRLTALVPESARVYCDPQPLVVWGQAGRSIVEVSTEEASDLIVMGVSSRGVLDRLFVGSTTWDVVRQATCPVLTVRA